MGFDQVVVRDTIREAVANYCTAMDAGDMDQVLTVFAPDAMVEMYGRSASGIDEIKSTLMSTAKVVLAAPGITPLRHFLSTQTIRVLSADQAASTTYVSVVGARGLDHWGAYVDRWTMREGVWRIAGRTVTLDGFMPGSAGERLDALTTPSGRTSRGASR